MQDNKTLAYFQEQLVDLLLQDLTPEEIIIQLKSDPLLTPFYSYIDTYDMTMLRVASELIKKWATENTNQNTKIIDTPNLIEILRSDTIME